MLNHVVPVKDPLISIPASVATDIVSAVYDVGDFMKEEIARLKLISGNFKPGLFWSKLNTNVHAAVGMSGCQADIFRAGFHEFLLVTRENFKLTFMRESRFYDVRAEVKAEGKLSYQNLLVQQYNGSLEAEVVQMALYQMHEYDKVEISERFNKLFSGIRDSGDDVGYYVMIIFEIDKYFELRRIKAVIVDPNFDIVEEQDWSHYIPVENPVIVEKISDAKSPGNDPTRGITLKAKAFERKFQKNTPPPSDGE